MKKSKLAIFFVLLLSSLMLSLVLTNLYPGHLRSAKAVALPEAIGYLPKDSNFVLYADLHRLFNSPVYTRFEQKQKLEYFKGLGEFIDKTGIDPKRDLAAALVGARISGGPGAALLKGNFNRDKILSSLNEAKRNITTHNYKGFDIISFQDPSHQRKQALAFLDGATLAMGDQSQIESYIDVKLGHALGLYANKEIMDLVSQANRGDMFWLVGATDVVLSQMPLNQGFKGKIPRIKNIIASGNLEQIISADVEGICADEKATKDLGDLLRGALAVARLSAGDKPDVMNLLEGIKVDEGQNQVKLSIHIPLALLEKLSTTSPSQFKF